MQQARQRHPNYISQAKVDVLVNDLILAFAKGLEFVWRNENKTKRNKPEWSVSVFFDTVSTSLITHWSQEYIYKQTHEYKELFLLKTLSQFLKVDSITSTRIEALYTHMMKKEVNIMGQEQEPGKEDKIIDLIQFKNTRESGAVFKKNITDYLDSIYYEKHFLIFGEILKNKPGLVLGNFFKHHEIQKLIESVSSP